LSGLLDGVKLSYSSFPLFTMFITQNDMKIPFHLQHSQDNAVPFSNEIEFGLGNLPEIARNHAAKSHERG